MVVLVLKKARLKSLAFFFANHCEAAQRHIASAIGDCGRGMGLVIERTERGNAFGFQCFLWGAVGEDGGRSSLAECNEGQASEGKKKAVRLFSSI